MVGSRGKVGAVTWRNDAGLACVDLDRLPADPCFACAGHGRQQPEAIGLRIVDGCARAASAIHKSDALKLGEISLRKKAGGRLHLGPARTKPRSESVSEFFGIGGPENWESPERIGQVRGNHVLGSLMLGSHGSVGSRPIPKCVSCQVSLP
jgi:hypothetical protein